MQSLEGELASLRTQHKAAAADRHDLELALADSRAQLAAAQEKVLDRGEGECVVWFRQ